MLTVAVAQSIFHYNTINITLFTLSVFVLIPFSLMQSAMCWAYVGLLAEYVSKHSESPFFMRAWNEREVSQMVRSLKNFQHFVIYH